MPGIEEFLASLQDEEEQQKQADANRRGYATRMAEKEKLQELKQSREETTASERSAALKAAGLDDFLSEAYQRFYPGEITEENLSAFKAMATARKEEPEPEPKPVRGGFAPTKTGSPVGTQRMLDADEYRAMRANPATRDEAIRAAAEGRVKLNNPEAADVVVTDSAGLFTRGRRWGAS